jgi:DNA-binding response OmpR family regulator
MMPKLSGIEFLKALRNNKDTRNLPVILISALDEAAMVQEGLTLGAIDYITKPFKINEIIGKLRHYLS